MWVRFLQEAIRLSATFLYGSTGETLIEKSGHLNLGIPGVMSVGGAAGCITVLFVIKTTGVSSPFLLLFLPILVTLIAGALMGLLFSFLTVTLRANQNVVGLAMTTFGVGLAGYLVIKMQGQGLSSIARASKFYTNLFQLTGDNWFVEIFLSHGVLVYLGIILAIVMQIIMSKTRTGLNLRAVGENPATADAVGINVTKYRYISTCGGCAISAMGGLCCVMDYMGGNWEYVLEGFGWLAIALVIFTVWRPALAILGSILFSGLYTLAYYVTGIPVAYMEILKMLPYFVTALVLIITSIFGRKSVQPPAALGTSYFREER